MLGGDARNGWLYQMRNAVFYNTVEHKERLEKAYLVMDYILRKTIEDLERVLRLQESDSDYRHSYV